MQEVNHKQLQRLIKLCYKMQKQLLVLGAPGIGKSQLIRETAQELAKEQNLQYLEYGCNKKSFGLYDQRASTLDPTDIRGVLIPQGDGADWVIPKWLPKEGKGIIFLDEINLSPISIQASLYQLINDRRVGGYCYSKDTRIMTKKGLKYFYELSYNDELMTLNPLNQKIEYHKPIEIIDLNYEGEMYEFRGKMINQLVSPNHNMLIRRNDTLNKKFRFMKAKDLAERVNKNKYELKKSGDWIGENKIEFEVPIPERLKKSMDDYKKVMVLYEKGLGSHKISSKTGIRISQIEKWVYYKHNPERQYFMKTKFPMRDWVEFLGWYLSEGCVSKTHHYEINIAQSKKKNHEKYQEIENLLKRMGVKYRAYEHDLRFCSNIIGIYLKQFGKAGDKFIPEEIKSLDKQYLEILLSSLLKGDGCENRRYFTKSERLMNDFIEIAIKCGYGTTFSFRKKGEIYVIGITKKATASFKENLKVQYNDKIYCVTVQNHIIMVERKGKLQWSGNSLPEGWVVVAAGNRGHKDKSHTFDLPAPLQDRFLMVELNHPSAKEWVEEYALNRNIRPEICAFLGFKPDAIYRFDTKINEKPTTPRGLERLSEIWDKENITDLDWLQIVAGANIGQGTAIELVSFVKIRESIDIEGIFRNPEKVKEIQDLSIKWSLLSVIAEKYKNDHSLLAKCSEIGLNLEPDFALVFFKFLKNVNKNHFEQNIRKVKGFDEIASKYLKYTNQW